MARRPYCAIVGLGFSKLSREPVGSVRQLAATAIRLAIADAGLKAADVDGLLINQSALAPINALPLDLHHDVGFGPLRLLSKLEAKGSSVLQMVQYAALAVQARLANAVVCVFADTPVSAGVPSGASFGNAANLTGIGGWDGRQGMFGPVASYALVAERYFAVHQTQRDTLAAYSMMCRQWSAGNPLAFMREPLSMEQYLAARFIVEPLRVFDCAYPVNGGVAIVVTACDRARDAPLPPVYVHGMAQGHVGVPMMRQHDTMPQAGALAAAGVYADAGVSAREVTMCQFYDAFSISPIVALEAYGLCGPGEAGRFVQEGHTGPAGRLPVNTGGGQLASYYLQGMTPFSEAIIQARGQGGKRQSARNQVILVNGSGGCLEYQAALIVSPQEMLT